MLGQAGSTFQPYGHRNTIPGSTKPGRNLHGAVRRLPMGDTDVQAFALIQIPEAIGALFVPICMNSSSTHSQDRCLLTPM